MDRPAHFLPVLHHDVVQHRQAEQKPQRHLEGTRPVTAAVQSYQSWQRHLGRDINPTELIAKIREAGAKRVKLTAPADIVVGKTQLPKCTGQTVTYGGLEDD